MRAQGATSGRSCAKSAAPSNSQRRLRMCHTCMPPHRIGCSQPTRSVKAVRSGMLNRAEKTGERKAWCGYPCVLPGVGRRRVKLTQPLTACAPVLCHASEVGAWRSFRLSVGPTARLRVSDREKNRFCKNGEGRQLRAELAARHRHRHRPRQLPHVRWPPPAVRAVAARPPCRCSGPKRCSPPPKRRSRMRALSPCLRLRRDRSARAKP